MVVPFPEFLSRYSCLRKKNVAKEKTRRAFSPPSSPGVGKGRKVRGFGSSSSSAAGKRGGPPRRRSFMPKSSLKASSNSAFAKAQRMLSVQEKDTETVSEARLEEDCSVLVSSIRAAAKIARLRGKFDSRSANAHHMERRAQAMRQVSVSPDGKGMRIAAEALEILNDERRQLEESLAVSLQPIVRGWIYGHRIASAWRDVQNTVRSSLSDFEFSDAAGLSKFRVRLSESSGQLGGLPALFSDGPFEVRILEQCAQMAALLETKTPLADHNNLRDQIERARETIPKAGWCAVLKRLARDANEICALYAEQAKAFEQLSDALKSGRACGDYDALMTALTNATRVREELGRMEECNKMVKMCGDLAEALAAERAVVSKACEYLNSAKTGNSLETYDLLKHAQALKRCLAHGQALESLVSYMERIARVRKAKAANEWKQVVEISAEIENSIGTALTPLPDSADRGIIVAGFHVSVNQLDKAAIWSREKQALDTLVKYLTNEKQRSAYITSETEADFNIHHEIEKCSSVCVSESAQHILRLARAVHAFRKEASVHPESALGKQMKGINESSALAALDAAVRIVVEEQRIVRAATADNEHSKAHGAYSELPMSALNGIFEEIRIRGSAYIDTLITQKFDAAMNVAMATLRGKLSSHGTRNLLTNETRPMLEAMMSNLETFCADVQGWTAFYAPLGFKWSERSNTLTKYAALARSLCDVLLKPSAVRDCRGQLSIISESSVVVRGGLGQPIDELSPPMQRAVRLFDDLGQSLRFESLMERMNGALAAGGIGVHSDGSINVNCVEINRLEDAVRACASLDDRNDAEDPDSPPLYWFLYCTAQAVLRLRKALKKMDMREAAIIVNDINGECETVAQAEIDFVTFKLYEVRVTESLERALESFCRRANHLCSFSNPHSKDTFASLVGENCAEARALGTAISIASDLCRHTPEVCDRLRCLLRAAQPILRFVKSIPLVSAQELLGDVECVNGKTDGAIDGEGVAYEVICNSIEECGNAICQHTYREVSFCRENVSRCASVLQLGSVVLAIRLVGRKAISGWTPQTSKGVRERLYKLLNRALALVQRHHDCLRSLFGPHGIFELASNRLLHQRGLALDHDFLVAIEITKEIRDKKRCKDYIGVGIAVAPLVTFETKALIVGLLKSEVQSLDGSDGEIKWKQSTMCAHLNVEEIVHTIKDIVRQDTIDRFALLPRDADELIEFSGNSVFAMRARLNQIH